MAGKTIGLPEDFRDLLAAFVEHRVRFLVVGAYALAVLGRPRATGDLDVWIEPSESNARRTYDALIAFGAPLDSLTIEDLYRPGTVFQIGLAPLRIDLLTAITGVEFAPARSRAVLAPFDGIMVPVLGRADFIANKRATGRLKDLADVQRLEATPRRRKR